MRRDDQGLLAELLRQIAGLPGCRVLPAVGTVNVTGNVVVAADVRQLFELCGGMLLFEDAAVPRRVCGPGALVPASPRLLTLRIAAEIAAQQPEDLTNTCYVIVDGGQWARCCW